MTRPRVPGDRQVRPNEYSTSNHLTIGIEHVFEAHPLRVEVEIDVTGVAVTILAHEQLRRAFDVARRVVHAFAIEGQHDVRMMLPRAECAEVVELGPPIRSCGELRQLCSGQYGDVRIERQRLQRANRGGLLLRGITSPRADAL